MNPDTLSSAVCSLEKSFIDVSLDRSYCACSFGQRPWDLEQVGPLVLVGLDEVLGERFVGAEFDDRDGGVVDEHEHSFSAFEGAVGPFSVVGALECR